MTASYNYKFLANTLFWKEIEEQESNISTEKEPGLTQSRTKVGVIHELPLRKNQVLSLILRKS
jgi:hypothetical protein